ncbi:lysophospholipid acyltransferase family protein [Asaia krungthepensis]|nr:lysophospholipid acyltransferase family protein [Asaia krungthepensis]
MQADRERFGGRSPFLAYWVSRALTMRAARHFSSIRWSGERPSPHPGQGVIFYTNHPSWWDPALFALIQSRFFPDRPGFGPIDAAALARYPLLGKAGFLPVNPRSLSSIRDMIRSCRAILSAGGIFWITAQGEFTDTRRRPVSLRPGIAHLALDSADAMIVPVALDYCYGTEARAEAFIRFGKPLSRAELGATRPEVHHRLETELEATLEALSHDVAHRRLDQFKTLAKGRAGMGGLYAVLQRIVAMMKGQEYEPRHARR